MKKEMAKLTTGDFSEFFVTNPTSKTQTSRGRALSAFSRPGTSKFSTIRSVTRGIRNLNITEIVRPNRNLLELQAPSLVLPEQQSLNTLAMIKKVHDKTLTLANQQQRKLKALRADNDKLKIRQLQTFDNNTQIDRDNAMYQQQAKISGDTFQNTCWTMKCYQWMADRLKSDKMVFEKRLLDLQEQLKRKQSQLKNTHEKYQNTKHLGSNTVHVLNVLRQDAQALSQIKNQRLQAFQQGIDNQRDMKQLKDTQLQQIDGIMQYAMQQKGANQKTWRNLFLAHKFVKGILKAKMQRQMKKFSIIQDSYQKIKMQSGVIHAEDIVKKFMLRDESYGNLLASISDAQRKITLLKKQNQELKLRQNRNQQIAADLDKPLRKAHINLQQQIKKVTKASQLTLKSEKAYQQLFNFAIETLKKIDAVEGRRSIDHTRTFSKSNLREVYDFLNQRIKALNIEDIRSQINSPQLKQMQVINPQNIRINKQQEPQFQQNINVQQQEQQDTYINIRRTKLNKLNAQFFLDLRKKYEDNLRARLQKQKLQALHSGGGKRGQKQKLKD